LPVGEIREVRRGGLEVLSLLSKEIANEDLNAYLRSETTIDGIERVGIVAFNRGEAVLAIHQGNEYCEAVDALLEFESDAHSTETRLSLHIIESIEEIITAYPQALLTGLIRAIPEQSESGEDWWRRQRSGGTAWSRQARLPEEETIVEAPEHIRKRAKSEFLEAGGSVPRLWPGDVLLHSSSSPDEIMQLTAGLSHHGRPTLVISRQPSKQLSVKFGLRSEWLSHKEGGFSPAINSIQETVEEFLSNNLRAIIAFEGLEFLAGEHGESRMLDLLRRIADQVRSENHLMLISCDLNAFLSKDQHLILREANRVENEWIEHWNSDIERLIDHPICAETSEAEREWIAAQIEPVTIPDPIVVEEVSIPEFIPQPTEPVKLVIEPPVPMPEPEPAGSEPEPVVLKGPRKAQVVRVKRKKPTVVKEPEMALAEVSLPELEPSPELLEMPAIPMDERIIQFSEEFDSGDELDDVIKQPAARMVHEMPEIGSGENQIAFHDGIRPSPKINPPEVSEHAREAAFADHLPINVENASKKWHDNIVEMRDESEGDI